MAKKASTGAAYKGTAAVATVAAAAAAIYFLTGKRGAKTRRVLKKSASRAKSGIIQGTRKLGGALKNIDLEELEQIVDEVKSHWKTLRRKL